MPDTSGVSPAAKQCYVVASNSFIAEDAAQVLRESLPECDVQLFDHPDSAASALQLTDEHVHVWMIGPRWDLARHALATLVGARDGLMVILSAEPLEDYLGVLPDHFAEWRLEDRYVETHIRKRLPANWKASVEAFIEAYHVRETHAGGRPGTDPPTQYDVFGDNVSRFVHTIGSRNRSAEDGVDEQERLSRLVRGYTDVTPVPKIPEGVRARDFYARHLQEHAPEHDQPYEIREQLHQTGPATVENQPRDNAFERNGRALEVARLTSDTIAAACPTRYSDHIRDVE